MDDSGDKQLQYDEFVKAVKDYRVDVPEEHLGGLFRLFDRDGSGSVDYDEFLRAIRGPMNEFRTNLALHAFAVLDKTGDGIIALEDIKGIYNAKNHPDVRMGKKTEDEILGEFLSTFETHHSIAKGGAGRDQRVDREEFVEYYANVSCSIDDDRYFELMMKNAWNLDK
jgi:Ca2+-binding EF-hand superfamily protein